MTRWQKLKWLYVIVNTIYFFCKQVVVPLLRGLAFILWKFRKIRKYGNKEASVYINKHILKFLFWFFDSVLLPYSHCYSAFMTWRYWLRFSRFFSNPGDTVSNLHIYMKMRCVIYVSQTLSPYSNIYIFRSLYISFHSDMFLAPFSSWMPSVRVWV